MKIEVWSDFVCPFCNIGKRRLEEALEQFPHKDEVEVVYKSFELDPNASVNTDKSLFEVLASKYGTSVEQAKQMSDNVAQQAATVGLDFQFDKSIPTNTFDAHRVAKFAKAKGKDTELTERFMYAHFTEGKNIGNHDTITEIAEQAGLEGKEVRDVLSGSGYEQEVRTEEAQAQQIGVQGVPFFVINEKYAISGAQSTETFAGALNKVWQEENEASPLQSLNSKGVQGETCSDDGCDI
ncbi:DsbA family oxidoreductase [Bacillus solimangrovi]|uniref:Disulfide bond formation protein DsbA n=1 Tax=Bacillus solimangrovi TaxID=1305675 RepID=A0A1E5LF35_9BACI|nr:DsbA family oxidoreductase [Bacillus solimangrovi]OEH92666.1 disulfide bond formation protein DsbA [Bacillus solimangrovi]